jgi:hypothetical protein
LSYDKFEVKEALQIEEVAQILDTIGAEPEVFPGYIVAKTVCHHRHDPDEASRKLYYYDNSKLFKCYSDSCGVFDVFELLEKTLDLDLNAAVSYVVNFCNLQWRVNEVDDNVAEDWKVLERYKQLVNAKVVQDDVVLQEYDESILKHFPRPEIPEWEAEGIPKDVCDYFGICYNPLTGGIVIPHRDVNGRLIGIRERTLVKDNEVYGKYRPSTINGKLYNSPLSLALYGLDKTKENIARAKTAILVEGEKSVLKAAGSILGTANNIAVAVCGSSVSKYQIHLLLELGVREVVVAFDADYRNVGDEDYWTVVDKLKKINQKFSSRVNVSFMFDRTGRRLGYKQSPFDCGRNTFMELWKDRIAL